MSTSAHEITDLPGPRSRPCNIFICHREEDQPVANSLEKALKDLGGQNVQVHQWKEMDRGIGWRDWIRDAVSGSDVLIFLYTDDEADWRWCLYELGFFRGVRGTQAAERQEALAETGIACIKNVDIEKPPDPIADISAYDATAKEIQGLFNDVIWKPGYADEQFQDNPTKWAKESRELAAEVVRYFNQTTRFYRRRFGLSLAKPGEGGTLIPLQVHEATVEADPDAVGVLDLKPGKKYRFRQLMSKFKDRNQSKWLEQLQDAIEQIKSGDDYPEILSPFESHSGTIYIPVISRTEVVRVDQPVRDNRPVSSTGAGHENMPSKVYVLLIPMPESGPGIRTLDEVMKSNGPFTVYPPAHVLRIRWHRRSHADRYEASDLDSQPVVCSANYKFKQLFDYNGPIPAPNESNELTIDALLERVREYGEDEYMDELEADQNDLFEKIVLNNGGGKATKTLQFHKAKESGPSAPVHPSFPGKVFLPYLVCKQQVGKSSGPHETYLFVVWIEDFSPQHHVPRKTRASAH